MSRSPQTGYHDTLLLKIIIALGLVLFEAQTVLAQNETTSINIETSTTPPDIVFKAGTFVYDEKDGVKPGSCPPITKVSICNDSITKENITALKQGWVEFGNVCDPAVHRTTWGNFWLNTLLERTIHSLLFDDNVRKAKSLSCSELIYQKCDEATRKCICEKGAIFENGSCKLIEAALAPVRCGDDLVPIQVGNLTNPKITDPRSCLLNFSMECAGTAECSCLVGSNGSFGASICNPRKGELGKAVSVMIATLKKALELKWLAIGQKCSIHENFSSKYNTHVEIKLEVIRWLDNYVRKFSKICNPFENEECDAKTKICVCSKGFIVQDGKCHLKAMPIDGPNMKPSSKSGVGSRLALRTESCEWIPEFNFYLPHNDEESLLSTLVLPPGDPSFALIRRTVLCVKNATCKDGPESERNLKVCKCESGKICQTESQVNEIGHSQIVSKYLHVLSFSSTLAMLFLSGNPL